MSAESIIATNSLFKLGDASSAVMLKAAGFTEAQIAAELATAGCGKQTVITALQAIGSEAEAVAATETIQFAAAEDAASAATMGFGAKLSAAAKGLGKFLIGTTLGRIILLGTAIFVVVKAFDYLNKAQDRAVEQ